MSRPAADLVVTTYATAALATAAAAYTFVQRQPERAKLWSNIATAFATVVILGFTLGWLLGLAVDYSLLLGDGRVACRRGWFD